MADLDHWWGDDLSLTPSGDLSVVRNLDKDNQRIFRRLCTNGALSGANLAEYVFEPDYGGSAPWYVGRLANDNLMAALIRTQMSYEASVSQSPEPAVTVTMNPSGTMTAVIQYIDKNTGRPVALQVDLNGTP